MIGPSTNLSDITRCPLTVKADVYFQGLGKALEKMRAGKKGVGVAMSLSMQARTRRFLGGPGSWPPRCTSKCGRCSPCRPVHVPVPPGTPVTTEYYPEAWRCKCGNKLYMP
ncbi:hypothetical protein RJ639_043293 [Escallonia herrerae]|uniref:Epidermal patterning factor-like protein n=1 Tax=Escallonia herrerae TaxID=1293975 RepID=A0AA89B0L6_9ASTE|nr:hypothetical protein RJ639_043293 [Escallonia herrerae]